MTTQNKHKVPVQPYVTYILIAINILVFIVGGDFAASWGAVNRQLVWQSHEYYRLLTAMFLHAGIVHIASNMFALFYFGRVLEAYVGHTSYALIYMLGGLIGSAVSVLFNAPTVFSVGASGAVFAVLGGGVFYFWRYKSTLGDVAKKALSLSGRAILLNLINAINPNTNIDNWAHVGGLIGGVFICALVNIFFTIDVLPDTYSEFSQVETYPRAFRILVSAASIVMLALASTLLLSLAPRTISADHLSLSIPFGWRTTTDFSSEEFCQKTTVNCLVMAISPSGFAYELDRFSGVSIALASLEDFSNAIETQLKGSGGTLQPVQTLQISGHEALSRVYQNGSTMRIFTIIRDGASIARIVASGNSSNYDRAKDELQTLINSLQFLT